MDISHANDDEAELQVVEQKRSIRRCYTCGITRHIRPNCPLRKPRYNRPSRNTTLKPEIWYGAGKRRLLVGAERPTGEELRFVNALGGRTEQGLSSHNLVEVATKRE